MAASAFFVPDELPLLSRGKHRSPRKGACLMELVSVLAGERWSDHPGCTHPLLATLARNVNDCMSDEARSQLAVLAPALVGLAADDLHVDARVALRCARTALPVVSADRQDAMAVAILASERVLDDLDGRPPGSLEDASRRALEQAPKAAAWARQFARDHRVAARHFRRHAAPHIVASAVRGIARAGVGHPDRLLYELVVDAIGDIQPWVAVRDTDSAVDVGRWDDVCRRTGVAGPASDG